jgi:hypothetical protein
MEFPLSPKADCTHPSLHYHFQGGIRGNFAMVLAELPAAKEFAKLKAQIQLKPCQ